LFWVPFLGAVLGPWILFVIVGAQNGAQKWNPKQGPKYDPNQDPKMQSGAPNLYWDANKVYMIFIQRSAGRSYSIVQQTNNFNQRRKGNLGWQNCSNREHEYIHRPNVVKTCFTCRRYTVKSHAGENQQHACYGIYNIYNINITHYFGANQPLRYLHLLACKYKIFGVCFTLLWRYPLVIEHMENGPFIDALWWFSYQKWL
jgi:hypothetical protein